jgi:hypothetical protein
MPSLIGLINHLINVDSYNFGGAFANYAPGKYSLLAARDWLNSRWFFNSNSLIANFNWATTNLPFDSGGGFTEAVQCVAGDTVVRLADGTTSRVDALVAGDVLNDGLGGTCTVIGLHVVGLGNRTLIDLNGVRITDDHPVKTLDGWAVLDHEGKGYRKTAYDQINGPTDLVVSVYDPWMDGAAALTEDTTIITVNGPVLAHIVAEYAEPDTLLYSPIVQTDNEHATFVGNDVVVAALRMLTRATVPENWPQCNLLETA